MTVDEAREIVAGADAIDLGGVARMLEDNNLLYDKDRKLAAAVLTLVKEGRETGVFLGKEIHIDMNGFLVPERSGVLRALAGEET